MDEIEQSVLRGLRSLFKDPAILIAFAQGYEEERRRLGLSEDTQGAADAIRQLIARVVANPEENGFSPKLEGRLAKLLEAATLYPDMRVRALGGMVVAEERFVQYHRQPVRFVLRSCA